MTNENYVLFIFTYNYSNAQHLKNVYVVKRNSHQRITFLHFNKIHGSCLLLFHGLLNVPETVVF